MIILMSMVYLVRKYKPIKAWRQRHLVCARGFRSLPIAEAIEGAAFALFGIRIAQLLLSNCWYF
jgi:hypothetical protein